MPWQYQQPCRILSSPSFNGVEFPVFSSIQGQTRSHLYQDLIWTQIHLVPQTLCSAGKHDPYPSEPFHFANGRRPLVQSIFLILSPTSFPCHNSISPHVAHEFTVAILSCFSLLRIHTFNYEDYDRTFINISASPYSELLSFQSSPAT